MQLESVSKLLSYYEEFGDICAEYVVPGVRELLHPQFHKGCPEYAGG